MLLPINLVILRCKYVCLHFYFHHFRPYLPTYSLHNGEQQQRCSQIHIEICHSDSMFQGRI